MILMVAVAINGKEMEAEVAVVVITEMAETMETEIMMMEIVEMV
jgi:hypothetical protein